MIWEVEAVICLVEFGSTSVSKVEAVVDFVEVGSTTESVVTERSL